MFYKLLFTCCLLVLLQTVSCQNTTNTTYTPCTQLQYPCSHICTVSNQSAVCSCNQGWHLHSNGYKCVECEPGTYGHSCLQRCNCGQGNGCGNINGSCLCNSCWSGFMCSEPVSASCFRDFLINPDKSLDTYGNKVPVPHNTSQILDTLRGFFAPELATTLLGVSVRIVSDRPDNARELLKLTVNLDTVNYLAVSQQATSGARAFVKLGKWRCTLVVPEDNTWIINI